MWWQVSSGPCLPASLLHRNWSVPTGWGLTYPKGGNPRKQSRTASAPKGGTTKGKSNRRQLQEGRIGSQQSIKIIRQVRGLKMSCAGLLEDLGHSAHHKQHGGVTFYWWMLRLKPCFWDVEIAYREPHGWHIGLCDSISWLCFPENTVLPAASSSLHGYRFWASDFITVLTGDF